MASILFSERDKELMRNCLELAEQAQGKTSPNPMVGAIVTDQTGQVVGKGFHAKAGQAHAEVFALSEAGSRSRGGTLYVSLEPCCHQGRTGPCTELVIKSGVARVVIGIQDPNPKVSGNGISSLRAAGITVEAGLLESECYWLNRAFIKKMSKGLPWLTLKMASSLDGRIADQEGNSRWISGAEARAYVHELRNKMDCVLIGGATAHKDNPQLNVRDIPNSRDPLKAIVDPQLLLEPEARACNPPTDSALTIAGISTYLFSSTKMIEANTKQFAKHIQLINAANIELSQELDLKAVMEYLAAQGVLSILCEGGGRLAGALLEAKLVDEIHWIIAPKFLLNSKSIPALDSPKERLIADNIELKNVLYKQLGQDMLITGIL